MADTRQKITTIYYYCPVLLLFVFLSAGYIHKRPKCVQCIAATTTTTTKRDISSSFSLYIVPPIYYRPIWSFFSLRLHIKINRFNLVWSRLSIIRIIIIKKTRMLITIMGIGIIPDPKIIVVNHHFPSWNVGFCETRQVYRTCMLVHQKEQKVTLMIRYKDTQSIMMKLISIILHTIWCGLWMSLDYNE